LYKNTGKRVYNQTFINDLKEKNDKARM